MFSKRLHMSHRFFYDCLVLSFRITLLHVIATLKTFMISYFFIFSKMGIIMSKLGRFPGSSFMQILISFAI